MGKSNKKIKNDRINTLRKQYDAYLEEDKKRRERNEYILGKLDKMRYSTALVPTATKGTYHQKENLPEVYMRSDKVVKTTVATYDNYVPHSQRQHCTSDLHKNFDESSILKEISKRYILIPKRITQVEIDYGHNKETTNDEDWRSKYNILENLKKQEKEGHVDNEIIKKDEMFNLSYEDVEPVYDEYSKKFDVDRPSPAKNSKLAKQILEEHDNVIKETVNFENHEINSKMDNKSKVTLQTSSMSSNDIDFKLQNTQSPHIMNQINSPVSYENIEPHQESTEENEKYTLDIKEKHIDYQPSPDINNDMQKSQINISNPEDSQESMCLTNYSQIMPENNEYEGYANVSNASYSTEIKSEIKLEQPNTVEFSEKNINQNGNIENQKESVSKNPDVAHQERIELHDGTDTNLGSQIEGDQISYETSQHYEPTQDKEPGVLENMEHLDHDSEINAFETEQKEMFYSEQSGGDTYVYNQGDNPGEYTAENYEQNEQYAYYEGVQQDPAYSTIVNEHEEATERYDPHYNQQYEGAYENQQPDNTTNYENASEYEQQQQYQGENYENQHFENVVNYENQQDNANLYQQENIGNVNEVQQNVSISQDNEAYDQQLYSEQPDNLSQEHIEQQLLTEEGFIDNSLVNTVELKQEQEDGIERVMDITNPVDQVLEPKFS